MRKIANVLEIITMISLLILGSIDVNDLTIWHVIIAVVSFIPFIAGRLIERCLED